MPDNHGNEPLQEAIVNGHAKVVEILKKAGATLSETARTTLENQMNRLLSDGRMSKFKQLAASGLTFESMPFIHTSIARYALKTGQPDFDSLFEAKYMDEKRAYPTNSPVGKAVPSEKKAHWLSRPGLRNASFALMEACPPSIAAAMLDGREVQPISTTTTSLFYSDIVGFTRISSTLSAAKVSRMLNDLFKRLDRLAYLHGVQKVDVVGDAYIAATNFTEDQPEDHAARLARFAIDAVAAAQAVPIDEDDPGRLGCLQVRVGLHCGPVVGIVADRAALKYTLIGETAVTAARMESSGAAGRIQCSAAAARLIAQQAHDVMLRPR